TPVAARLFRLLGLHPGPDLSAPAAASLTGLPVTTVRPVLGELTRASLLAEHTHGRYTFHDLLRAYATDLAHRIDTDQQRRAATPRMLDHYLHTAHTAEQQALAILNDLNHADADQLRTKLATLDTSGQYSQ